MMCLRHVCGRTPMQSSAPTNCSNSVDLAFTTGVHRQSEFHRGR